MTPLAGYLAAYIVAAMPPAEWPTSTGAVSPAHSITWCS